MLRWLRLLILGTLIAASMIAVTAQAAGQCRGLTEQSKTQIAFSSDRMVVSFKLNADPTPLFNDATLLKRPRGWMPPFYFKILSRLTNVVRADNNVDLTTLLEVGRNYTYILKDNELVIGRIPETGKETFSKHLVLAAHQRVLVAGELKIDANGTITISNASGSYRPPVERLVGFAEFLNLFFGVNKVQATSMDAEGNSQIIDLRTYEQ